MKVLSAGCGSNCAGWSAPRPRLVRTISNRTSNRTALYAMNGTKEPLRVLFCTQDMDSGFRRTHAAVQRTLQGVEVTQCHRSEVGRYLGDADIVVPIAVPITRELLSSSPRLKLVIQYGVGVDAIDTPAATELGVCVANIPSGGTGNALSVAEHAIYLTLASLRHHNAMTQSIQEQRIGIPEGLTIFGSTVLIIGYGNIAQELVTRLIPFGPRLVCLRRSAWAEPRTGQAADFDDVGSFPADVPRLAAQADIIILTCTLNPSSRGIVGPDLLRACKRGVHIVNIARGGLLDRTAVAAALQDGTIGGMGLDAYWHEPYGSSPDHAHDGIGDHSRVYMTPHVAGVTAISYESMAVALTHEIARVQSGQLPSNPLNALDPKVARLPLQH